MAPDEPAPDPAAAIAAVQAQLDEAPYHHLVRMLVEEVDREAGRVVLRLPYRNSLQRLDGTLQVHGGPIASVIDTAGTYAVSVLVGHGVPTVNLRVDYLRPAVDTDLVATAVVRRAGRSMAVADVDLHDGDGRLVAVGRGTWSTAAG
ncbi:MAG: PaaI family thioesterase [Acidimicrobiia bacterium]|nr:PaaI family thioesterase [Acidimicrobiia bacterium]